MPDNPEAVCVSGPALPTALDRWRSPAFAMASMIAEQGFRRGARAGGKTGFKEYMRKSRMAIYPGNIPIREL